MLAQHDLSLYLTRAKNNTNSTLDLHREKEGGRTPSGWRKGGDEGMRGRQSEKTGIRARERGTESERWFKGAKENKSLIIYLGDTSGSTFSSGQWCLAKNKVLCRMLHSVWKSLSHDLTGVNRLAVCAHSDRPGVLRCSVGVQT